MTIFLTQAVGVACAQGIVEGTDSTTWNSMIDAIIFIESRGNPKAVGGNSVGILQITPICVREANAILKQRGEKRSFTYQDRYNVQKSKEMFELIQSKYNPNRNIERAIRLWNGGPNYGIRSTQGYYNKVMGQLKKLLEKKTM